MGMNDGGSFHYGYDFEILNTFEMGLLKKNCVHTSRPGWIRIPLWARGEGEGKTSDNIRVGREWERGNYY